MTAWNSMGNAALIRELSSGPEGGGATLYYIFDFTTKTSEVFTFSSSFSPGDGTEPERIAASECAKNAAAANVALAKLKFKTKFAPEKCKAKTRVMFPSTASAPLKNGVNSIAFTDNASCASKCRWNIAGGPPEEGACF